jgi:hypothetical protein
LLLTHDRVATWRWGAERLDGAVLDLLDSELWPRRGGVEGGFKCSKVRGLL